MSGARESILLEVRAATEGGNGNAEVVAARLNARSANVQPARSAEDATIVSRFVDEATRAGTDVREAATPQEVPGIVAAYLREQNMGSDLRVSGDPLAQDIPWEDESLISVSTGPAGPGDSASLSVALAGIAETGTLMMRSSANNPAMLNYLPLAHVAVLPKSRIVGGYETAWNMVRELSGGGRFMSRMINLITGPSRTADIEQQLLMGAHGPQKHLIVILDKE